MALVLDLPPNVSGFLFEGFLLWLLFAQQSPSPHHSVHWRPTS